MPWSLEQKWCKNISLIQKESTNSSLLGGTFILKWNIMTTENKVSIHFQMMLKNHFSCYAVMKATYQSFPSNTALDSVPMPAIWLTLSTSKYTQFHFMITNFHYLIAAYSVSLDMLFEYWYRYSLHMRKNKKEVLQTSLVFHCETFLLTGMLAHDEKMS